MARTIPKVLYGLHFAPGVAEYKEPGTNNGDPFRIYLSEETIKNMDPTFAGRPVYVRHVDEVNLDNIQEEADGFVTESFFNKADGKHWVKFLIVSDKGHTAIQNGWKLSNAYRINRSSFGGKWHGVEYQKEVVEAEYDHLAIVPNPRYAESIILTPEEFKAYNSEKEIELARVANEEGESKMSLKFWSKKKVDNSVELEGTVVELPKSKIEMTITQIINEVDEAMIAKNNPTYANGDHKVKVGEEEMTVNELIQKHAECMKNLAAKETSGEDASEEAKKNAEKEAAEKVEAEKKANAEKEAADKAAAEKKENEEKAAKDKEIADKKANADAIRNADQNADKTEIVETSDDRVARGKARYGSGK